MFGVIICPKCHRARGARIPSKTAACAHCGHRIDVAKARVYFRTGSEEELRRAVQRMTELLATNIEDYPAERKRRARAAPTEAAKSPRMNEEGLRELVTRLSAAGDFGAAEVREALGLESDDMALKVLERMIGAGLIYERSGGRFRSL